MEEARDDREASCCRSKTAGVVSGVRCSAEVAGSERKTKSDRGSFSSIAYDNEKGRSQPLPRKAREIRGKISWDTFGRLRTPSAARELALCTLYRAMWLDVDL